MFLKSYELGRGMLIYLLKDKFRENANIIADVFTFSKGKVISGIVYGGNSRKIRNYLQIWK